MFSVFPWRKIHFDSELMNNIITGIHKYLLKHSYLIMIAIVLFTILTLVLTLLPSHDIKLPTSIISHDKVGHFLLFGGWTFLIGYYRFTVKPKRTNLIFIFLAGVVFGGCVELIQGVPPFHRDPSLYDWAADAAGAFCSTVILFILTNSIKR